VTPALSAEVLDTARQHAGLSIVQLWFEYAVLGGSASLDEVGAFLAGVTSPGSYQYDMLAQALNDVFVGQGGNHPVPYAEDSA
jgi:hypothetical protein